MQLSLSLSLSLSLGVKFLPTVSLLAELVTFAADAHLLGASCNLAPKCHDKGISWGEGVAALQVLVVVVVVALTGLTKRQHGKLHC